MRPQEKLYDAPPQPEKYSPCDTKTNDISRNVLISRVRVSRERALPAAAAKECFASVLKPFDWLLNNREALWYLQISSQGTQFF